MANKLKHSETRKLREKHLDMMSRALSDKEKKLAAANKQLANEKAGREQEEEANQALLAEKQRIEQALSEAKEKEREAKKRARKEKERLEKELDAATCKWSRRRSEKRRQSRKLRRRGTMRRSCRG